MGPVEGGCFSRISADSSSRKSKQHNKDYFLLFENRKHTNVPVLMLLVLLNALCGSLISGLSRVALVWGILIYEHTRGGVRPTRLLNVFWGRKVLIGDFALRVNCCELLDIPYKCPPKPPSSHLCCSCIYSDGHAMAHTDRAVHNYSY